MMTVFTPINELLLIQNDPALKEELRQSNLLSKNNDLHLTNGHTYIQHLLVNSSTSLVVKRNLETQWRQPTYILLTKLNDKS